MYLSVRPISKIVKLGLSLEKNSIDLFSRHNGKQFHNSSILEFNRCSYKRGRKKIYVEDGQWVSAGTILSRQIGVKSFPGLNVGLGRNRDLYAKEHGIVYITTEKVNPNYDVPLMETFFGHLKNNPEIPLYRTHYHVICEDMPQVFKLVDRI